MGVVLLASGVARADYIGIPIDSTIAPYGDEVGDNAFAWGFSAIPGYFYFAGPPDHYMMAEFTRNTFTVTVSYSDVFEMSFFSFSGLPAFSEIALLSSNVPSLLYSVNDLGDIVLEWIGSVGDPVTGLLNTPDTATFSYVAAPNPVPEPSSIALLGTGCLYGLNLIRRKRA